MTAVGTTFDPGSVLAERFALSALLGTGTSARVFLATDLRLHCPVAVKVLHESLAVDPRFVAQLRREARLAASLSHDHIVTILDSARFDVDETESGVGGIPYIVTEYMAGGALAAILDSGTTLDAAQTASVGIQAADALAYAHGEGVVHRDVKPSNLLFDADGRLALADFGIARAVAEASATERSDSGVGATRYASPEAVMGRSAEPAGDVYSLGLVLIECLTGTVPLLGDTPVATMGRRVGESVEVPEGLGALGEALVAATRRDPQDRAAAGELADLLREAADELGEASELPLQPLEVSDSEDTAELTVDRSGGSVKILGVAPMGAAAVGSGGEDLIDLTDSSGEAGAGGPGGAADPGAAPDVDADPDVEADTVLDVETALDAGTGEFGRDAITVAQEYYALDASRPGFHGVVEPLKEPLAPAPLGRPGAQPAKARSARDRSVDPPGSGDVAPAGRRSDDRRPPPSSGRPPDSAQPKRPRRWIAVAALVLLVVGGGAAASWWFFVRVPTHEVPQWVGGDMTTATKTAEANGWKVGEISHDRRDGTSAGQILAQDPAEGTSLAEGEQVTFTVSDGPTLTPVPQLAGVPESDALAQLEAAGLVAGTRSVAHDESVPAGSVISSTPAAGSDAPDDAGQVPKGTAVDFVVSDGPAPRVVPEGIVGVSLADAEAKLAAVQLGAKSSEQYSSEVAKGLVISTDTSPGAQVPRDSVVSLVVSAGPEPIVVPDVTGRTGTDASAALKAKGFTVSGIEGDPSGAVLATDPPGGESRLPGASIRIFTRTG